MRKFNLISHSNESHSYQTYFSRETSDGAVEINCNWIEVEYPHYGYHHPHRHHLGGDGKSSANLFPK